MEALLFCNTCANVYKIQGCKGRGCYKSKKKGGHAKEGIARCTFEDKIKKGDIVFLRAWTQPIERKPRKFNPLVIPKSLQAALPFASKPKNIPHRRRPLLENRRAVVMEPHERKVHALVQHLQLIRNEKMKKRKTERRGEEEGTRSGACKGRATFQKETERGTAGKVHRTRKTKEENPQKYRLVILVPPFAAFSIRYVVNPRINLWDYASQMLIWASAASIYTILTGRYNIKCGSSSKFIMLQRTLYDSRKWNQWALEMSSFFLCLG
ncbi:UNVERIFIED_CONTAM: Ribosome biogenesis protein BMS1 [Sesamum radiatum]|uniref:Ribosome biogenesis protein BMS1 n=1 Tax=Sesamum radiatum TaxID=300843 RepID=A0AAW2I8D8_SESRA